MKKSAFVLGSALVGVVLLGGIALAASSATQGGYGYRGATGGRPGGSAGMAPGVFGTVSAVSGSTLTVTETGFGPNASTTTVYTVNAANATVMKNGTSSALSDISVGDRVMVRGTVSGTSVTATSIYDGMPPGGMGRFPRGMSSSTRPTSTMPGTPPFVGNGEPVVGGTVTAISGTTLTVTNKSNITYTVEASSATVVKGNTTSSLSAVNVNDNVLIQGTVNGNAVTATSIIDQGVPPQGGQGQTANGSSTNPANFVGRMFGGIGSFFQHLFGFF